MHIATDGETYGHHHRHGEMALAYALHHIESNNLATVTNYGEYLEKHPPTHEVEIVNNTSWSCAHGIERWRSNCGCNSGMKPGWNQDWRAPLRNALDQLRDGLAKPFEEAAGKLLKDPAAARDEYIDVILDRSKGSLDQIFREARVHKLERTDRVRALKLLEMQRHAHAHVHELRLVLRRAFRASRRCRSSCTPAARSSWPRICLATDSNSISSKRLAQAHSNLSELGTGADIYQKWVKPAQVNLLSVGAHYAIASLFDGYTQHSSIYSYDVNLLQHEQQTAGRNSFRRRASGRSVRASRSNRTRSRFGVLHFGDHNLNAGVRYFRSQEEYDELVKEAGESSSAGDIAEVLRVFNKHFDNTTYNLKSLVQR